MWHPGGHVRLNRRAASAAEILNDESAVDFISVLEQDPRTRCSNGI